jgi:hypothetical protein
MPTSTFVYFLVLLVGFGLQYACDVRSIAASARQYRLSPSRIRWSPLAGCMPSRRFERFYSVHVLDQHGRSSTRTCRVSGVIGLPIEVDLDPVSSDRTARRGPRSV